MPMLNWIGKEPVVNHHLQVSFHLPHGVPVLACGDPGSDNLIVEGGHGVGFPALRSCYPGPVRCLPMDDLEVHLLRRLWDEIHGALFLDALSKLKSWVCHLSHPVSSSREYCGTHQIFHGRGCVAPG